ncbi:hypothetical protein Ntsu_62790 [Nocardia sp. IFM 10818]
MVVADRPGPPHTSCARDAITRKGKNLSKITVEQEPGLADTLLTAELDETHTAPTFAELGVREEIVRSLAEIGIERTFAIQELTLPLALAGEDLIGQARTGMGKTFGFGVPLLHRITTSGSGTIELDGTPRALIIVPTRELCIQVTADLENASKHLTKLRVTSIYGGRPYESQIAALRSGVDVVVGTPGRLLDLAQQGHLILGKVQVLVLDEADEMLDLGFLPDIERILTMVPEQRQTMLFSATMPGPIITLARTFLNRPTHIRAEEPHDSAVHDRIAQFVYRAHALDKTELLARVLQAETRGATMIFARTKRTAQKVADDLAERGFSVGAVHGDLGQIAREKALKKFREGKIDVLVATDVAARGIDIDDVTHVVNYQCPEDEKTYVHRIGRTGRAGRAGVAVTLVDWDELHRWASIDKALDLGIPEPVETYSRSPHLYADLGIPEGSTGQIRKPKPQRDEDAVVVDRESRSPRKRNRRRTRAGQPIDGETTASTPDSPVTEEDSAEVSDKPGRRRRRRRRGGNADTPDATTTQVAAETANPTADAPAGSESDETGTRNRRNRRRNRRGKGSTDTAATVNDAAASNGTAESNGTTAASGIGTTADSNDAVVAPAAAPAEPIASSTPLAAVAADSAEEPKAAPRKRTRRTTKTASEAVNGSGDIATDPVTDPDTTVTTAESSAEPAKAAPRKRTRRTAATEAVAEPQAATEATGPSDADATTEPKKRTRRTTKTAAAPVNESDPAASVSEAVAEVAETTPKKRVRRTTEAAETAADPAPAVNVPAEGEVAPKKRVRRTVKPTVEAEATANGSATTAEETPKKRTRRAIKPADAAVSDSETAATAEAAAAAPKKRVRRSTKAETTESAAAEGDSSESVAVRRPRRRKAEVSAENATAATDTAVAASA